MGTEDALWAYADDLQRYAAYMCRHAQDGEDVAQTTLMKAAEKIEGFRGEASVRTWLHTIATNECRMLRRRTQPDSLDQILDTVANARRLNQVPTDLSDPEALVLEAEARRAVVAALDRLPERYRQVLVLKDGCGLRSGEIADLLQTTVPSTIRAISSPTKASRGTCVCLGGRPKKSRAISSPGASI